ncbi:hypothetical protein AUJ61_00365 [Candidatus Pacearchaeota archaeon CG1_02_30_18]|nr:MAG: hypothetical protein AUJ61_00365 [Candidatus Pacearchaeota archaeon CG1_02_30_18]
MGENFKMIKAIIFDIGEVLLIEKNRKIENKLVKKFSLNRDRFRETKFKYLNKSLIRKKEDFWFEKKIAKKFELDPKEFINHWQELKKRNFKINKEILEIIQKLDKKRYLIWSLTDVNYSHDLIRKSLGVYDFFKSNIKSINLNTRKPLKKIYKILLKKLGHKPEEIVFIDDMKINLEVPKNFGVKTILFKNAAQLKKDLNKFGVKI